ncbi:MAG: hypothetical protein IJA36_08500 [Lachnospiraceae bacterium]|nr:hypothetical protein [Lachnospiraceae bacterium]
MKAAVEIYINMIVLILITSSCVFFISSSLRNAQARNFHSTVTAKIEASSGSERVINDSIMEAMKKGYTLNISPVCLYEDKNYYYVELLYEYEIPFMGTKRNSKIEGYAR